MNNRAASRAVLNVVRDTIALPDVPADPNAAPAIAKAVQPIIDHALNAEAWWRSRVTLGSLTSMIGGSIAIGTGIAARSTDAELYASGLAALIGGGFALYGRWLASRPLGR